MYADSHDGTGCGGLDSILKSWTISALPTNHRGLYQRDNGRRDLSWPDGGGNFFRLGAEKVLRLRAESRAMVMNENGPGTIKPGGHVINGHHPGEDFLTTLWPLPASPR